MKREAMPKVIGVRMSGEDRHKLAQLCEATRRPASEVLRLLVQQARTADVPVFEFVAPGHGGPTRASTQERPGNGARP